MSVQDYLNNQLHDMFSRLHAGEDVAPAHVYRLEGYMQALIMQKQYTVEALVELIAENYQAVYGCPMTEVFPPVTKEGVIALPIHMRRAPVR